jgi:superfamily II DNA/RNA helicase
LLGVKQFYCEVPAELTHPYKIFNWKVNKITQALSQIPFHQCIIFCNHQARYVNKTSLLKYLTIVFRAEALCQRLNAEGWVNEFISGQKSQQERINTMENLKRFKLRILVSTDLVSSTWYVHFN